MNRNNLSIFRCQKRILKALTFLWVNPTQVRILHQFRRPVGILYNEKLISVMLYLLQPWLHWQHQIMLLRKLEIVLQLEGNNIVCNKILLEGVGADLGKRKQNHLNELRELKER